MHRAVLKFMRRHHMDVVALGRAWFRRSHRRFPMMLMTGASSQNCQTKRPKNTE
jgi:hypothetical protein